MQPYTNIQSSSQQVVDFGGYRSAIRDPRNGRGTSSYPVVVIRGRAVRRPWGSSPPFVGMGIPYLFYIVNQMCR